MTLRFVLTLAAVASALLASAQAPRASSPQAWIREHNEDSTLFDYSESAETIQRDGQTLLVTRMRFVERLSGEDAYRETLTTDPTGAELHAYEVQQLQLDEKGTIVVDRARNKVLYRYYKNKHWKETEEKLEEPYLVGAMIPKFIQLNEKPLLGGLKVRFHLAVPYMTKSFNFALQKSEEVDFEGRKMVSFELFPTHLLVKAAVRSLYFTYDPASRETRRILGKVFLKKRTKSGWEGFQAETLFLKEEPKPASETAVRPAKTK
jgi:hypothetical protein